MIKTNGNGKGRSVKAFEGEELEFPVTYNLKAVMPGTEFDDDNKQKLVSVFNKNDIKYNYLDKKISSKGTYASFTYRVTLISRVQMDKMYADLKKIKEIKFAL